GRQFGVVLLAGEVEGGPALEFERNGPAHRPYHADQLAANLISLAAFGPAHGHEIRDFGKAGFAQEAGEQDIGVRQVNLLEPAISAGSDAEAASLGVIENRGEDARRI